MNQFLTLNSMDAVLFGVPLRTSPSARFAPSPATRGSCISLRNSNHESSKVIRGSAGVALQRYILNHHIERKPGKPSFFLSQKKFCANAVSKHSSGSEPEAYGSKNAWTDIQTSLDVFYRFTRPHTIIGTALSILSVSLLAVESMSDISPVFCARLLEAVAAALFMNIYIVNKPNLPLAWGEYSVRTGVAIVSTFAVLSFIIEWAVHSWPLFWAPFISSVLGTAYSINLPFFRWKSFALVAAICILAVRAVIVQLAFFLHMQTFVFQRPAIFSKPLIFATAFMSFFSVVIALFKDIPDIDGDRIFGIRSFSVRLGQKRVLWTCIYLLEMAYSVAVMMGLASSCVWSKVATVLGNIILAGVLWPRTQSIDLKSKAAITSFYMFIWKLFYAEYLLIPLVR